MSKIEEKVEQRLQEAQANKEFKDIGRVSNLKKTKAAYRLIDMSNLSEIETDEVQAFNTVKKDLVWQPIDVNLERQNGTTAGATWLKIKIREAVPTKPNNNKNKRASYVMFLTKLQGDLSECYNVKQIEDLSLKYRKLPVADIISYLLDSTYAEKSQEDKKVIDELVKKNYNIAMIYGAERLMSQVVEEVFSKRFANILFKKGDTSYETYAEAKDKEPITKEQSDELIANLQKRKENFINANRQNQEDYRNYTIPQLKNAMDMKWQLSPLSKQAYKENIENFRSWAIEYYERQIKREIEIYNTKIEASKPKDNDWSWHEIKKEKSRKISDENKLIANRKEPLSYIKRTGGYKIGEVSVSELKSKYGYVAVNYGNYLNDPWSKQHTKFFLQAMSDMGEIFNINIKELNQIGKLDISFGAKGSAGHAATYFPQTKDINITKTNGDGSVAHEYGHYFDNMIVELDKRSADPKLASEHLELVENENVKKAMKDIVDFFYKGNPLYTPKMKVRFFAQPSEIAPTIPYLKDRRWERKPIEFKPTIDETLEQCSEILIFDENLYQSQVRIIGYIINHFELDEYEVEITLKTSMFFQKSRFNFFTYCFKQPSKYNPNKIEIVRGGSSRTPYWTSNDEMFARAWETILFKKILNKNRRSDYLVSGIDLTDLNVEGFQNPYPSGSELDYLETLYDKLIIEVKKAFNLSDFVPYNTEREDMLVEFESKKNSKIKTGINVTKSKKSEVVNYIKDDKVVETTKQEISSELQKGIEVEQEHIATLESVADGKITPQQAIVETAQEHISENPKYYQELAKIDKKIYPNIKSCLLADGDNENDFIVEGTKIYNNEGVEEWEIIGFQKNGMVLKHNPKTKLTNEKGVKEITFDELKDIFSKKLISIQGIKDDDFSRLNVCIKAIEGCIDKIDSEKYKINLKQEIEKAKKEQSESPSKVDMSEFYKIVREAKDFESAFSKARLLKNVNAETSTYFYSKYNPTGNKSGKDAFKSFYEEVRGVDKTEATSDILNKAYNFGRDAHDSEKQRIPAIDKNLSDLINLVKSEEVIKVLNFWIKGWDDARQNEMRMKFPEMYAPKSEPQLEIPAKETPIEKQKKKPKSEPQVKKPLKPKVKKQSKPKIKKQSNRKKQQDDVDDYKNMSQSELKDVLDEYTEMLILLDKDEEEYQIIENEIKKVESLIKE
jgi:hypothetical protein